MSHNVVWPGCRTRHKADRQVTNGKLTEADVVAIREAIDAGTHGTRELARFYEMLSTIHNIARYKLWKLAGANVRDETGATSTA